MAATAISRTAGDRLEIPPLSRGYATHMHSQLYVRASKTERDKAQEYKA